MNDSELERWKPVIFLVFLPAVAILPYEIMKYYGLPPGMVTFGTILVGLIYTIYFF